MMGKSIALAAAIGALSLTQTATADVVGELAQLPGTAGCYSLDGASDAGIGTCTDVRDVDGVSEMIISPDGRSAYTASYNGARGLAAFARDPGTGALTQLPGVDGCYSGDGSGEDGPGSCTDVRALFSGGDGRGMSMSRDGRFLYVASQGADSVLVFARDAATSRLTQLAGTDGCVSRTGAGVGVEGAGTCADGLSLDGPAATMLTPDERHLIVVSYSGEDSVAIFSRDGTSGRLTQLAGSAGCMTPDGSGEGAGGACADLDTFGDGIMIVVSPDGRHVYLSGYSEDSLLSFSRDAATGELTQLPGTQGCMTVDGVGEGGAGTCADGRALDGAYQGIMSDDGRFLYVGAYEDKAILTFSRDPQTGVLTQLAGVNGCTSADGTSEDGPATCTDGRGLHGSYAPVISPDQRHLYFPHYESDSVVSFARDAQSGVLTQFGAAAGCTTTTGAGAAGVGESAGTCVDGRGLNGALSTAMSPDGAFLYVPAVNGDTISVFARQLTPVCTDAAVSVPHGGTVTVPLPCSDPNGNALTRSIASDPAGGTIVSVDQGAGTATYTARFGFSGTDRFAFAAADTASSSPAATATVEVGAAPAVLVPPPIVRPPDRAGPRCTGVARTARRRDLLRGRLNVRLRCDEAARLGASLTVARSRARVLKLTKARGSRPITVGRGTGRVGAGNRAASITVRLSSRVRSRLRRAGSRRLRATRMTLVLTAIDAAGNRRTTRTAVRVTR